MGRRVTRAVASAVLCAAAVVGTIVAAGPATGAPAPGPGAGPGGIHPGVATRPVDAQCTSNFVFRDGDRLLLGQAAHCTGTANGVGTDVDGCTSPSQPLGSPVRIDGATQPGTLVYNSWIAMQAVRETDPDACAFNDFALIEIDRADHALVSPRVPAIGGPTGLATTGPNAGERVTSYGNSELRGGLTLLSPKFGTTLGTSGNGWNHTVTTVSPGVPGDSGSGFLTADGRAFGVLSTLNFAPAPGSNGVGDLARMLQYARDHGLPNLQLVTA